MLYDFHTHTFLSDGVLLPIELIRRAAVAGYQAIGVTDHASAGNLRQVLEVLVAECRLAEKHWEIRALPGVELTHVPPEAISELAREARPRARRSSSSTANLPSSPWRPAPIWPGSPARRWTCWRIRVCSRPKKLPWPPATACSSNSRRMAATPWETAAWRRRPGGPARNFSSAAMRTRQRTSSPRNSPAASHWGRAQRRGSGSGAGWAIRRPCWRGRRTASSCGPHETFCPPRASYLVV